MRFAIAIIVTSIVTLAGCSPCLDAFKLVEVGKPLPDKLPAGLYRTGISLGRIESPRSPMVFEPRHRRLQVLTDNSGLVVGKAVFNAYGPSERGSIAIVAETTTLEVQVPPEWWNEPTANWGRGILPTGTQYIPALHGCFRTYPKTEQRAFVRQWKDWYERRPDDPGVLTPRMNLVAGDLVSDENAEPSKTGETDPTARSRRTALDYLCLVAQLLEAVPVRPEGASEQISSGGAPVASAPISLISFGQDDLDPRQVIVDGFKWQGQAEGLEVTCENLGDRRIRLEVVRRRQLYRGPIEEVLGDLAIKILGGMLQGLATLR